MRLWVGQTVSEFGTVVTRTAVPIVAILVFGGARWWDAVDNSYERTMYRPPDAVATVLPSNGRPVLSLTTRDTALFRFGRQCQQRARVAHR